MLEHSHKKKYSLETCVGLLFMLLQDFFASARPHGVYKKELLLKSAVHYSHKGKSLTSHIYPFCLFNSNNFCIGIILLNGKD